MKDTFFGEYTVVPSGLRGAWYIGDNAEDVRVYAARHAPPETACPVLVVGEDNPYGSDPNFALFPMPTGCSGHRLCTDIFAIRQLTHLALWRANLCEDSWSTAKARARAHDLLFTASRPWRYYILLGRKVADAFKHVLKKSSPNVTLSPFSVTHFDERGRVDTQRRTSEDHTIISLPHPSGRNVVWNKETVRVHARMILTRELPNVAWGETL